MKHVAVASSNIRSIAYDAGSRRLEVIFHNGGHFSYADVAPEKYDRLLAADSPGSYVHTEIRNAHAAERVTE